MNSSNVTNNITFSHVIFISYYGHVLCVFICNVKHNFENMNKKN